MKIEDLKSDIQLKPDQIDEKTKKYSSQREYPG